MTDKKSPPDSKPRPPSPRPLHEGVPAHRNDKGTRTPAGDASPDRGVGTVQEFRPPPTKPGKK